MTEHPHVHIHCRDRSGRGHGQAREPVVAYDHARHALLGDAITLDFINTSLEPGARGAVELSLDSARALCAALGRAIAAAEREEAEVRGAGRLPKHAGVG